MKRTFSSLAALLAAGCILPAVCYYGTLGIQAGSITPAVEQFLADWQGSSISQSQAPHAASQPAATAAPLTEQLMIPVRDTAANRVLRVPLREYIIGAVASEMPITWPDAALQAQAVATHSYLLYCRDHNDTVAMGGAWLTADPARRQGFMTDAVLRSYWGTAYEANFARLSALVDEVLDQVLYYDGAPACASYFALSNGRTEASQNVWTEALPYLQGVDSSADKQAENYAVTTEFTSTQMHNALNSAFGLPTDGWAPADYFTNYIYTDAGYVYLVNVCGQALRGTAVRSALKLRSACFTVSWDGEKFLVTSYGYGHGVGLSQTGAKVMAEQGSSWQDILQHYFPGTSLQTG